MLGIGHEHGERILSLVYLKSTTFSLSKNKRQEFELTLVGGFGSVGDSVHIAYMHLSFNM